MAGTTSKGVPYATTSDNNDTAAATLALANWVDAAPGVSPLTTSARDALAGGAKWVGRVIHNTTTKQFEWWDGTTWQLFGVPRGSIIWLAYRPASAPAGYLLANGAAYNTTTYSDLNTLLGSTHGAGLLPNMTRRVPVGYDAADLTNFEVGKLGGVETQSAPLLAHFHDASHDHPSANSGFQSANHVHGFGGTTGGMNANSTHNHMQPSGYNIVRAQWIGSGAGYGLGTITPGDYAFSLTNTVPDVNLDHGHNYSGNTNGVSADHYHAVDLPTLTYNTQPAGVASPTFDNRMPWITLYACIKY